MIGYGLLLFWAGLLLFALGHLLREGLWRGPRLPAWAAVPAALGFSLAAISAVGLAAAALGLSFGAVRVGLLGVLAGLLVWKLKSAKVEAPRGPWRPPLPGPHLWVAALALGGAALAYGSGPWLSHTADTFYHLAAARSILLNDTPLPQQVFFREPVPGPDLSGGSWHLALALLADLSGLEVAQVWVSLSGVMAAVAVLSLYMLAEAATDRAGAALLGTIAYFALAQRLDFRAAAYPSQVGLGVYWVGMALLLKYLGAAEASPAARRSYLWGGAFLGLGAAAMHLALYGVLIASLAFLAFFCLLLRALGRPGPALGRVLAVALAPALLALPAAAYRLAFWPGAEGAAGVLEGALGIAYLERRELFAGLAIAEPSFWFPGVLSIATAATVVALGLLPRCARGEAGALFLVSGAAAVPALVFTPFVAPLVVAHFSYPVAKLATLMPFVLYLVFGWGLYGAGLALLCPRRPVGHSTAALYRLGALGVLAFLTYLGLASLWQGALRLYRPASDHPYAIAASQEANLLVNWQERLGLLEGLSPPRAVVLSDPTTSYYIGGLTRHWVVAALSSHTPAQVEARDGARRRGDALDFLDMTVDAARALSILEKYGVEFVLVDRQASGPAAWRRMESLPVLERIYAGADWRLYRYDRSRWGEVLAIPMAPVAGQGPLLAAGLERGRVVAGDSLFLAWEWRPGAALAPGKGAAGASPVQIEARGLRYGAIFRQEVPPPAAGGVLRQTVALRVPEEAAVDRYQVLARQPGRWEAELGQVAVGREYEAEEFRGVVPDRDYDYDRVAGWASYSMSFYSRHKAAITKDTGATMRRSIGPLPAGDYRLGLWVYDYGNGGINEVEVAVGGAAVTMGWGGGREAGVRWVEGELKGVRAGGELSLRVRRNGQGQVIVDQVVLYPW